MSLNETTQEAANILATQQKQANELAINAPGKIRVIKRNGKKNPFDRDKLSKSLLMALRKRQTDDDAIERAINGIVRQLESRGDNDIHSKLIGELVMNALAQIDNVAYIRYASVYRNFREASDFGKFVEKEIKD